LDGFLVSKVLPSDEADHSLLLPISLYKVYGVGTNMKIPVGTSWEVPNGVETEVYVDIGLKYDPVDILGNSFIAVLSICARDKGSARSSDGVTYSPQGCIK